MKIIKVRGKIREAVNYLAENQGIVIGDIDEDTIVCPINQSLPENIFRNIDCFVCTMNTHAYVNALAKGDLYLTFHGPGTKTLKNKLDKFFEKYGLEKDEHSYKRKGKKVVVFARNPGRLELTIFRTINFKCNNSKLTEELNKNKDTIKISLDRLVEYLTQEMKLEISEELPETNYMIKNNRGTAYSCTTGKPIFDLEEYIERIRCPIVYTSLNQKVPSISLSELGSLNNTKLFSDYIEGDYIMRIQNKDNLDVIKQILSEKYKVKWLNSN